MTRKIVSSPRYIHVFVGTGLAREKEMLTLQFILLVLYYFVTGGQD